MSVITAEILFKFSVSAAAGNTTGGTAAGSLGDQISTTQITDALLNNLFDDISGAENAASTVDYRGIFVHNSNGGGFSLLAPFGWLSAEVAGGASISIGVDAAAPSAIGSGSTQMATIANELAVPAGATFTAPTTKGTGIAFGNLVPGNCQGFWIKRTAANTAAVTSDGVTIRVEGDTL